MWVDLVWVVELDLGRGCELIRVALAYRCGLIDLVVSCYGLCMG